MKNWIAKGVASEVNDSNADTRAQDSYQTIKDGRVMRVAQVWQCQNGAQKSQNKRFVAYGRGWSESV